MRRAVSAVPHLRLVRPGEPKSDRLSDLARRVRESTADERVRAIAEAIAEELTDMREGGEMPPSRVEIALHVALVSDDEHWVGHTKTIDRRALYVTTYLTRPVGSTLELRIELPDGATLEAVVVVAGVREVQAGSHGLPGLELRITSMSSAATRRWGELIELSSGHFWSTLPIAVDA